MADNSTHQQVIEILKGQLLIVFLQRLGGKADVKRGEMDDILGGWDLSFNLDYSYQSAREDVFHFELTQKATRVR